MPSYDWKLPTNLPLCYFSDSLYRSAKDGIFSQISDYVSPQQLEAVQSLLLQMKQDIEKDMPAIHYAAQFGTHICLEDIFNEASNRLKFLALFQAVPSLEPERQRLTAEEVVNNLENTLQSTTEDTYLGTETNPPNNGSNQ